MGVGGNAALPLPTCLPPPLFLAHPRVSDSNKHEKSNLAAVGMLGLGRCQLQGSHWFLKSYFYVYIKIVFLYLVLYLYKSVSVWMDK